MFHYPSTKNDTIKIIYMYIEQELVTVSNL